MKEPVRNVHMIEGDAGKVAKRKMCSVDKGPRVPESATSDLPRTTDILSAVSMSEWCHRSSSERRVRPASEDPYTANFVHSANGVSRRVPALKNHTQVSL